MIGKTNRLKMASDIGNQKASKIDLSKLFCTTALLDTDESYCARQDPLTDSLDVRYLLDMVKPALTNGTKVNASLRIRNTDRTAGTILGSELTRLFGSGGLPDDSIRLKFTGSAGQSFGAFVPKGITLEIEGDANDYPGI